MNSRTLLLTSTVIAGFCFSSAALAQTCPTGQSMNEDGVCVEAPPEAVDEDPAPVEEVVVTGSRIRRETFDTITPVFTVTDEEFERTAVGNAIDVINDINIIGGGSTSRGANTQFGDNFSFADIFNLGTNRTLTLVNGRRFVSQNQGSVFVPDNATGAQVDLTILPPGLIERVEVTPGTGGAVYGADAVAGVLNFILKDDFEGVEITTSAGVTDYGDGEQFRLNGLFGRNFLDDRLNVTVAADYFYQAAVPTGGDREFTRIGAITNPLNGAVRRGGFDAAEAAATLRSGGALPSVFLPANSDQITSAFYGFPVSSGSSAFGGLLVTGNTYPGVTITPGAAFSNTPFIPTGLVPATLAGRAADPQGFAFFAPSGLPAGVNPREVINTLAPGTDLTGLSAAQQSQLALGLLQRNRPTPFEYFSANPGLNPLLSVGTFFSAQGSISAGPQGYLPTIINTDPATSTLFPRVAVPLQFDPSGNLVPFNLGNIAPPSFGNPGTTFGGDGVSDAARGYSNLQSQTERVSIAGNTTFNITDNLRYRAEYLYADINFESFGGTRTNIIGGAPTAGSRAVPIFIDQNPFVSDAALAQIDTLAQQGLTVPRIGGERVLFSSTALTGLFPGGFVRSGNEVQTFRTAQVLEGDFEFRGREFYYDAAYVFGKSDIRNFNQDILDIEFALAADVVIGANGQPVCRQQTLAAPESIAIRNPGVAQINTTLSLTPTAEQVAACRPLNLIGEGNVSQEARDYIVTDGGSENFTEQRYYAASFGGELIRLPAGWISAVAQIERREETLDFQPGPVFRSGAGRSTTGQATNGELEFLEYGAEVNVPLFSEDYNVPFFQGLELTYAFRTVDRDQSSANPLYANSPSPGTTDDAYTYGFRWKVNDDLAFRGNRSQSVRSPSLVELFGSPQSAFVNSAGNPCTVTNIGTGPNPGVRRANCIRAVQLIAPEEASNDAEAEAFLANFRGTGGARPAAVTGNPALNNEQASSYGYGVTFTPRVIPRLTIASDFYSVDITGQLGLVGIFTTINQCFDLPEFPESRLGANAACDLNLFGVLDPATGTYVNPAVNPITGRPVPGFAPPPGTAATIQGPFETSFYNYINFNLAATRFRAANTEVRYNFPVRWLFGERGAGWGDIFLSASIYNLQRYDTSGNGTFRDVNRGAGEPGNAEFEYRFDFAHRLGDFDQRLTWFTSSETVANVQTPEDQIPEQDPTFVREPFNTFNYTAGYTFRDRYGLRLTINNLTNELGPFEEFGLVADTIGRTFILQGSARF